MEDDNILCTTAVKVYVLLGTSVYTVEPFFSLDHLWTLFYENFLTQTTLKYTLPLEASGDLSFDILHGLKIGHENCNG